MPADQSETSVASALRAMELKKTDKIKRERYSLEIIYKRFSRTEEGLIV